MSPAQRSTDLHLGLVMVLSIVMMTVTSDPVLPKENSDDISCCPPDLFNATVYILRDTLNHTGVEKTIGVYKSNYDYAGKRISIKGTFTSSSSGTTNIHFIIRPNVTYEIDDEHQVCTLTRFPFPAKHCLPPSSVRVGSVNYGDLETTAYRFVDSQGANIVGTVTQGCLPVNLFNTTKLNDQGFIISSNLVFSGTRTAVDESEFSIPSYCPH